MTSLAIRIPTLDLPTWANGTPTTTDVRLYCWEGGDEMMWTVEPGTTQVSIRPEELGCESYMVQAAYHYEGVTFVGQLSTPLPEPGIVALIPGLVLLAVLGRVRK